jgi:hypothetical protein
MSTLTYDEAIAGLLGNRTVFARRDAWLPTARAVFNNFGSLSVNDATGCGACGSAHELTEDDLAAADWGLLAAPAWCAAVEIAKAALP